MKTENPFLIAARQTFIAAFDNAVRALAVATSRHRSNDAANVAVAHAQREYRGEMERESSSSKSAAALEKYCEALVAARVAETLRASSLADRAKSLTARTVAVEAYKEAAFIAAQEASAVQEALEVVQVKALADLAELSETVRVTRQAARKARNAFAARKALSVPAAT